MSATFTVPGVGSWTPQLVTRDPHRRRTRVVVHELLGSGTPGVTILPTLARSGTLTILTTGPTQAASGLQLLSAGQPVALTFSDRPDLSMRFVVTGDIEQETDEETAQLVILQVPFQEVPL